MKKNKIKNWIKKIKTPAYWGMLLFLLLSGIYKIEKLIPDTLYIDDNDAEAYRLINQEPWITTDDSITVSTGDTYTVTCKLWNIVPLKTVTISHVEAEEVAVSGKHTGIYLEMEGILVIGIEDILTMTGDAICPAENLIEKGDYIKSINGQELTEKEDLAAYIAESKGENITIGLIRDGHFKEVTLTPVCTQDGTYKLGIWVRDNAQGIGTITYITADGGYAALGHGISDGDTGEVIGIRKGGLYTSEILSIQKGDFGNPGELHGVINYGDSHYLGSIEKNTECGIFGTINESRKNEVETAWYPIAYKQEMQLGEATIICTTDEGTNEYKIEIEKIYWSPGESNKCFEIHVTDETLLEKTGGIVQGLSGSPVLQDGCLVGAVTHVLVNDPTTGYGIFIENMLESAG